MKTQGITRTTDLDRLIESGDVEAIDAMIEIKEAARREAGLNARWALNRGMYEYHQAEDARYCLLGRQIDRLRAAL